MSRASRRKPASSRCSPAVHAEGVPVLLVEQEVAQVFKMADRNYVLSQGRILAQGSARSLMADETLRAGYLGL